MFNRSMLMAVIGFITALILSGCSNKSDISQVVTDKVKINEVMSTNHYYAQLPDGNCYDWIEFYNSSDDTVNLKGCMLSDNVNFANKWKIPEDVVIPPDGYAVIYLSGLNKVDEYGNIHTNFRLSAKGETLIFSNTAGNVVQKLDVPQTTLPNVSYGLDSNSKNYVWFAEPSPNKANSGNSSAELDNLQIPESGLLINEYMTKNTYVIYDSNNQYSDWIEIYNSSDSDVNLDGFSLSDSDNSEAKWFFPEGSVIKSKAYMVIFCSDEASADPEVYHADFKLSAGDTITLYSIAGVAVDSVKAAELNPNVSCGRDPKSGEFKLFASPTPGRANTTYSYELTSAVKAEPYSSVYVSEVMCVSDKDGTYANDFIEIHNASSNAVSLKGYGLSKRADDVTFVFPDIKINAGGYQTVYCTGNNASKSNSTLYAAFKLNQGGENIYFFDSGGHIIDVFNSGKQTYGHSSGRLDSQKNEVYVFESPSPGKNNRETAAYLGYSPAPVLSFEGGYVPQGFQLTISAQKGCKIYYTTNGDMPTEHSKVYQKPIIIKENTVVRAITLKDGYLPSQLATGTFLTDDKHSIPVVSVSSDEEGLFSAYHGIMSNFVGGLVQGKPNYESNEEREITFEYYIDGQKTASFNAMARIFGETSRKEAQKALAVILSERSGMNEICFPFFGENSVDVFSSFVLRPSGQDWSRAHMRDEFCSRILRGTMNVDYMEAQPVALYINGKYWGLYYLREKLNDEYLIHKYGMQKGKIDIVKWERIQQEGSRDDYLALCDYCENNDLTVKKNYDYVCSQIDIDSLMDWWIFETYIANNDTGNIRCYRDRNNGKWKWMLFDVDYAFSLVTYKKNYISRYMLGPYHGLAKCNNSIPRNLLKNQDFREKFIMRYFKHIKTTFDPDRLISLLDGLSEEIESEMPLQEARWGSPTVSYWNYNKKTIKNIINKKPEIARQQIKEAFRLSEKQVQEYYDRA